MNSLVVLVGTSVIQHCRNSLAGSCLSVCFYATNQTGGCGGFGKGNFTELFKSIEDYERVLDGSAKLTEKNVVVAADEAASAVAKP